jgi:carbamoyl-phosphate synthase large subunit
VKGGDALLPTMGGQTALNTALSLRRTGVLEKFGVEMIGANRRGDRQGRGPRAVPRGDDQDRARDAEIAKLAQSRLERWRQIPRRAGEAFPRWKNSTSSACRRSSAPSFTMGGTGGGIAYNKDEFFEIVERGLDASPTNEVLIEESVLGWKEYEMEVVRDRTTTASSSARSRTSIRWACIPAIRSPSRRR